MEALQNFRFNKQGIPDKTCLTSSGMNDPTKVIGDQISFLQRFIH